MTILLVELLHTVASTGAKYGLAFGVAPATPTDASVGIASGSVFAGVAVGIHEGVADSLTASDGIAQYKTVQLATMGHIVVKARESISVGDNAYCVKATGVITNKAQEGSGESAVDNLQIGKFVLVNASSGELAVLELG